MTVQFLTLTLRSFAPSPSPTTMSMPASSVENTFRVRKGEWRREGGREGEGRERKGCCDFLPRCLGDHEHRQVALLQLLFTDWLKYNHDCACVQVTFYSLDVSLCQLKACLLTIFFNWVAYLLPNTHTLFYALSRTWPALPCLHTQCPGEPPTL